MKECYNIKVSIDDAAEPYRHPNPIMIKSKATINTVRLINTIEYAKKITSIDNVYAILREFNLSGKKYI
jgi:hypothetical protein